MFSNYDYRHSKCNYLNTLLTSFRFSTSCQLAKQIFRPAYHSRPQRPRSHPFGQHQEPRPLAKSNNGSPRFTDFPSLCACSESSLTNLIGSGLNLLCLQSHSKTEYRWTRPEVAILGADQKERGLWGRECPRTEKFRRAETTSGGSLGPPKKRSAYRN